MGVILPERLRLSGDASKEANCCRAASVSAASGVDDTGVAPMSAFLMPILLSEVLPCPGDRRVCCVGRRCIMVLEILWEVDKELT